jgi:hypothetical protein
MRDAMLRFPVKLTADGSGFDAATKHCRNAHVPKQLKLGQSYYGGTGLELAEASGVMAVGQ